MGRGQFVQPHPPTAIDQTVQGRRQIQPLQMLAPGDAVQPRSQPAVQMRGEPGVGQVRPVLFGEPVAQRGYCLLYTSRCV